MYCVGRNYTLQVVGVDNRCLFFMREESIDTYKHLIQCAQYLFYLSLLLSGTTGPSVLLVVKGDVIMTINEVTYNTTLGNVIFISANQKINIIRSENQEDILMYRAYCNM